MRKIFAMVGIPTNHRMGNEKIIFRTCFAVLFLLLSTPQCFANAEPDKPFKQPVSTKYRTPESLKGAFLKKVVTDYNDNVYVLTSKGVYKVNEKDLVKDLRYTPLAQKIPTDIAVQEGSGFICMKTNGSPMVMPVFHIKCCQKESTTSLP